jgi:hypothetical protein
VAPKAYLKPGKLIALRHAMKNYLGRDSGLAHVIRAVVGGNLAPVGCTKRFRGITGYLFLSEELRKYRPVSDVKVPPECFLNYREAASSLGIRTNVVRGLVLHGVLNTPGGYRNGYSKLVPAKQVQRFAERYVAATVIAKHFNLSGRSFARHLRESGTPLLAVSIPDEGKGQALFLPKDTAAHVVNGFVQTRGERNHQVDLGGTRLRTGFPRMATLHRKRPVAALAIPNAWPRRGARGASNPR